VFEIYLFIIYVFILTEFPLIFSLLSSMFELVFLSGKTFVRTYHLQKHDGQNLR
jgi:hypothetical protein